MDAKKKNPGRPKGSKTKKVSRPELEWVLEHLHIHEDDFTDDMMPERPAWFSLLCWARQPSNRETFMKMVVSKGFGDGPEVEETGEDKIGEVAGVLEGLLAKWEKRKVKT